MSWPSDRGTVAGEEYKSEDDSSDVLAAIPARKRPQQKHGGQQGQQGASGKSSKGKYLCYKHTKFGEDAFHCADKKNCTWSGN